MFSESIRGGNLVRNWLDQALSGHGLSHGTTPGSVSALRSTRFATGSLRARRLPRPDARSSPKVLVWANLRGVDTHGVTRIPPTSS